MIRYSFKIFCVAFSACFCCAGSLLAEDNNPHTDKMMNEKLNLTQEWDKVFPKSDKVTHRKVSFRNRYGIMLAADLYMPRNVNEKLPAIAVSGPFGAVKEQASGLYSSERTAHSYGSEFAFNILWFVEVGSKCDAVTVLKRHLAVVYLVALREFLVPFLSKIQCFHIITCFLICFTICATCARKHDGS